MSARPAAGDLPGLARHVAAFIEERDWEQFHSPKNLAMSVAIEAAELMEVFQWLDPQQAERVGADPELKVQVEEEAADVFCYLLSLSNRVGFDLGEALLKKIEKNAVKYPADRFRGRSGRCEPDPGGRAADGGRGGGRTPESKRLRSPGASGRGSHLGRATRR